MIRRISVGCLLVIAASVTGNALAAGEAAAQQQFFENRVRLEVEDDGEGIDEADMDDGQMHFGLVGMQERAALLGGTFSIDSRRGRGTTIAIELASSRRGGWWRRIAERLHLTEQPR